MESWYRRGMTDSAEASRGDSRGFVAASLHLLQTNRDYRLLWLAQVTSLLGDWFNTIALYTLVKALTGSALAMGLVFSIKMAAFALASPPAGLIADRVDRRRLMIATDLFRGVVVCGFLFVDASPQVPWLYALIGLQMVAGAAFYPARSASIPNVVSPSELLNANALGAATWSTMLALGAALGGFATEWLGTDAVFMIDAATYLVAAGCVFAARVPQSTERSRPGNPLVVALSDILSGWQYLIARPHIGRIALAKSKWGLFGGGLVFMQTQIGDQVAGGSLAVGLGVLFAARGIGTGIGPIAARRLLRNQRKWPVQLGMLSCASGLFYLVVAVMPWTPWVVIPVVLAHCCSGANWVMATVILQQRADDAYRGRVFATEWLLLSMVEAVAVVLCSLFLEQGWLTLRDAVLVFAAGLASMGALWVFWLRSVESEPKASPPS